MAPQLNTTTEFSVVKNEVELVKPPKPTPSEVLSLSTIDNEANLEAFSKAIYVYQAEDETKSHNNVDPADMIRQALSEALVYYYPLAGRLKRLDHDGRLQLTCNATGVPFLVATANCRLSSLSYLDDIDFEIAENFVFPSPTSDCPFVLQVTKFACGGFTIGFGISHMVADGFGAAQIFKALAELSKGKELSVKPVWERERLVGTPIKEPLKVDKCPPATSPYGMSSDIEDEIFYVKSESIKRLKEEILSSGSGNITTFEILAAFVWRARLRALKLNHDGKTCLYFATGLRKLIQPPLPEGYYGNAFLTSAVELTGKELEEKPLSEIVNMIKEKKKDVLDNNYIRNTIDVLETKLVNRDNEKIKATGALMALTDWRNLGLVSDEFGSGWKIVNVTSLPWECFGSVDLVTFLPAPKSDPSLKGAVGILASLPKQAMPKFKEEIDALN
ncbi:Transferase [Trema orientale]|uniref:Transferase n=1 Tax=Trema orientale TaxID=63057 RepID=A0A2P5AMZ8_TREOI|nr:Transferase [Trema orientale]